MSLASIIALFGAMIVLALIPGPGTLAVVARSISAGFKHGISTTIGIVAGDFVFITLALLGIAALSEFLGELFIWVKLIGAAYLVWLGLSIALSDSSSLDVQPTNSPSHLASFIAGLVTTLSNPKAILFYLSFFPTFVNFGAIKFADILVIYCITVISVGGVMLSYAYTAHKLKSKYKAWSGRPVFKWASGGLLIGSGAYVATRG